MVKCQTEDIQTNTVMKNKCPTSKQLSEMFFFGVGISICEKINKLLICPVDQFITEINGA